MKNKSFSLKISIFHGLKAPEEGLLVGYAALIERYNVEMPLPNTLALISAKKRQYTNGNWEVFTSRHQPKETLYDQLIFALKYEGVNLLFFKKLFEILSFEECTALVQIEPQGLYSRKIWFLYEWLIAKKIPIPDLSTGNYVTLLNEKKQFGILNGIKSSRHRIINNLPGTVNFCPLIFKTEKITKYIEADLAEKNNVQIKKIHKDILSRTSAFLLLKDSKASFNIEGENPIPSRAMRWGKAINQAGKNLLTKEELERLQQIVIENSKFLKYGFRKQDGFVGEHDRDTHQPIPEHISAKHTDVELLMDGLINTSNILPETQYHPVLAAAVVAFGFVFIHPFVDGNGRLHRYIIHHVLAKNNFTPQGIIFPVSASIVQYIDTYRKVLEQYSHGILPFIQWKTTADKNVEVTNDTADFYKYYDATKQAEFLFDCIQDTIDIIIPQEVKYLLQYDEFKNYIDNVFEMPDKMVALLVKLLSQNEGKLSTKKKQSEFPSLTESEVELIEEQFKNAFEE
jgi:Fic family protein